LDFDEFSYKTLIQSHIREKRAPPRYTAKKGSQNVLAMATIPKCVHKMEKAIMNAQLFGCS